MLGSVGEELGILGRRIFWAVRRRVTDHHHDRPVRVHALRHAEEVDAVVGDQIGEVVLGGGGERRMNYRKKII